MGPTSERGQLILVGGVALALVFVALGVLLNSAAFAGAEAARDGAGDASEPLSLRDDATEGLGGALFYANYYDHWSGRAGINGTLATDTEAWSATASNASASHRTMSRVHLTSVTEGTQLFQNQSANFTNVNNEAGSWNVTNETDAVRRFVVNVSAASLNSSSDESDAFHIRFNATSGGDFEVITFYEDGGEVRLDWRNDSTSGTCAVNDDAATVDLSAGNVVGHDCDLPAFPRFDQSFFVEFDNPTEAKGRYSLVVEGTVNDGTVDSTQFHTDPANVPPYRAPALYDATLELAYRSATVDYVGSTTLAPEGTPRGVTFGPHWENPREIVFVRGTNERLHTIDPDDGTVSAYDATDVAAIGPMNADIDDDGRYEIPYVTNAGALRIVDGANETQTLVPSDASTSDLPLTSKTLLAMEYWDGALSVFYATQNGNGNINRVRPGKTPTHINADDGDNGIDAVAGVDDMDQDGVPDLLSVDGSSQLRYHEPGGGNVQVSDGAVGQNFGPGVGAPRDFDGDGDDRAPIVDTSGELHLINDVDGKTGTQLSDEGVKAPVAGIEWNDTMDGKEVVFVANETVGGSTESVMKYVSYTGGDSVNVTVGGEHLVINESVGVA